MTDICNAGLNASNWFALAANKEKWDEFIGRDDIHIRPVVSKPFVRCPAELADRFQTHFIMIDTGMPLLTRSLFVRSQLFSLLSSLYPGQPEPRIFRLMLSTLGASNKLDFDFDS